MNLYLSKLTNHKYGILDEDGKISANGTATTSGEIYKYNMFIIEKLINSITTNRLIDNEEQTTMKKQTGDIGGIPYNIDRLIKEVNEQIVSNYYGVNRTEIVKALSKIYCLNEMYVITILYLFKLGTISTNDLLTINKMRLISLKEFLLKKLEESKSLDNGEYFIFGQLIRDMYHALSVPYIDKEVFIPEDNVNTQYVVVSVVKSDNGTMSIILDSDDSSGG